MINVSTRSLKILSVLFWYGGSIVLLLKGGSLILEAVTLKPNQIWPWLAIAMGVLLGGFKARYLFSKSCKKNLDRIDAIDQPKVWQFFRPGFFVFLITMVIVGKNLSMVAHNNYHFLLGAAVLDFSIASALIGSSYVFFTHKSFSK